MEQYKQSVLEYGDYISFTDRAEEKGFEKGIEKGIKKGIEKSLIKFAKKCYKQNMSLKEIADFLEISEEEVYNLLDN